MLKSASGRIALLALLEAGSLAQAKNLHFVNRDAQRWWIFAQDAAEGEEAKSPTGPTPSLSAASGPRAWAGILEDDPGLFPGETLKVTLPEGQGALVRRFEIRDRPHSQGGTPTIWRVTASLTEPSGAGSQKLELDIQPGTPGAPYAKGALHKSDGNVVIQAAIATPTMAFFDSDADAEICSDPYEGSAETLRMTWVPVTRVETKAISKKP